MSRELFFSKQQRTGRKFFVCGDWKCNGTSNQVSRIVALLNGVELPPNLVEVVVSPRFEYLQMVKGSLRLDFHVAAQNFPSGVAFTGENLPYGSAEMLVNLDIPWVILGHSKTSHAESNEFVGDKVAYALSQGLKVIACIGETLEHRQAGSTMEVVAAQTKAIAEKITSWDNVVLAYEPVWAIGTRNVASPAQAQEVHSELREWLHNNVSAEVAKSTRIIYGGSVDEGSIRVLANQDDIDGFLVDGGSLRCSLCYATCIGGWHGGRLQVMSSSGRLNQEKWNTHGWTTLKSWILATNGNW